MIYFVLADMESMFAWGRALLVAIGRSRPNGQSRDQPIWCWFNNLSVAVYATNFRDFLQ